MTKPLRFRYGRTKYAPERSTLPLPAAYTALPAGKSSSPHPARAAYDTGPTLAGLPPGGRRRTEEQPFPPANPPPCIPYGQRTTQGRRSPACPPPAGDAAPKSSLFRCRHRSSAPSGIGRRARLSAPSAQTDGTTAKQPRKRGCLALGLYYLYRRQTAPRQNNPASAVAFALGLYYLCQRTNAYPL